MSAEQTRELSEDEVCRIPEIVEQMEDGKKQVKEYWKQLEQKYGNLRLQKVEAALYQDRMVVISPGSLPNGVTVLNIELSGLATITEKL